jgi:hypothetical protein
MHDRAMSAPLAPNPALVLRPAPACDAPRSFPEQAFAAALASCQRGGGQDRGQACDRLEAERQENRVCAKALA